MKNSIFYLHQKLLYVFKKLNYPNATFEIVGSYRRGLSNSGDIDVIISDKENDNTIFSNFIKILLEKNIVAELLSNGKTKSMAIGKLPGDKPFEGSICALILSLGNSTFFLFQFDFLGEEINRIETFFTFLLLFLN